MSGSCLEVDLLYKLLARMEITDGNHGLPWNFHEDCCQSGESCLILRRIRHAIILFLAQWQWKGGLAGAAESVGAGHTGGNKTEPLRKAHCRGRKTIYR